MDPQASPTGHRHYLLAALALCTNVLNRGICRVTTSVHWMVRKMKWRPNKPDLMSQRLEGPVKVPKCHNSELTVHHGHNEATPENSGSNIGSTNHGLLHSLDVLWECRTILFTAKGECRGGKGFWELQGRIVRIFCSRARAPASCLRWTHMTHQ